METLESSRVCRLCGKQSDLSINIFDKNEIHVKKINAILPIMVHEMDMLPKHMCYRCSYKLDVFHKFYVACLKTDADLKSQLSWMQKEDSKERVGVPMVHIENIKIKVEPSDYDMYDINPMVSNVDYINSMSSVTFPVNGVQSNDIPERITYTTYARCGCCCDKADQSNQTVPTNCENKISRYGRINDVRPDNDDCADESRTAKANLLAGQTFEKQSNLVRFADEVKDSRKCKPPWFDFNSSKKKSGNPDKEASTSTIVRNLRPRKGPVDYVGTRKKSSVVSPSKTLETKVSPSIEFDVSQIKVEKIDDFQGCILRPRKGTIDYVGPKRKYSRSVDKNQRLLSNTHRAEKTKVRNIANKLKVPSRKEPKLLKNRLKLDIKKEQLSDLKDMVFDESVSTAVMSLNCTGDITDQVDTLPNDYDANVQNGRVNCSTLDYARRTGNFSVAKWKSLQNVSKSKLKSEKIDGYSTDDYPSKYSKSHAVCLRSGKVRNHDSAHVLVRRSLRNLTNRNGKDLIKAIRGTITAKISTSMKLFDIKHYCEECNMSFPNKELLKLHVCYGH